MNATSPRSPSLGIAPHPRGKATKSILLCLLAVPLILLAVRSQGLDFRAFHVAGKAVAAHLDPYADNRRYGAQFTDVANENGISRWIYPPPALFFAEPLGFLSFTEARLLFEFLSIAFLLWTLLFLGRRFCISLVWLGLACISLPVIACVQRGQVDLLILFCVVLAYRLSGRCWAGIPLGVAISIKVFPAALLLWWLLERRFKEAATAIAFTTGLSLLAAWRFGPTSYTSFLHNLTTLHSQAWSGVFSDARWLSLSPGFVGSYNNPLILFNRAGIFIGFMLTVLAALFLRVRRVSPEIGFFSMALISQSMNTALWTMGMVMYIPICLIAISRLRSRVAAILLFIPLYMPSQILVFGITPRLIVALLLIAGVVFGSDSSSDSSSDLDKGVSTRKIPLVELPDSR